VPTNTRSQVAVDALSIGAWSSALELMLIVLPKASKELSDRQLRQQRVYD